MQPTPDNILTQLKTLRQLFAEAAPTDPKVINDYAWIIVKAINREHEQLGSIVCRQLLADYVKLSVERPSQLHSAVLSAAVKVANAYPDFRFASFLRLWGIGNLRPEDNERQRSLDGKSYPSLAERVAKALGHSVLLHQQDRPLINDAELSQFLSSHGLSVSTMLVTRVKEAMGKDGRKYIFVTLTSPEGIEVETISHNLQPSPLQVLPGAKRHYVNIGQLYNCLLKTKATVSDGSTSVQSTTVPSESSLILLNAVLSQQKPIDFFPQEIGYIEAIDTAHGHMHVYDAHSRHFVANIQRFSKERVGDFVRFIPIIPQASKFKTAIILATVPSDSSEVQTILREIRIININKDKGYASWELVDKSHPITELLSPLQLSQGETSPAFTTGYLHLATIPAGSPAGISAGQTFRAFIYLKRGKDRQKRPHIAKLFI